MHGHRNLKLFMNCYISDMLRSIALCKVSEHNTWNASDVYKDGTEENMISFIPGSVTWKRKSAEKNRLKYSLYAFGEVG